MESALYDFYSLAEAYQKTHSFAALTRSFSDTSQLARTFHEVISISLHCSDAVQCDTVYVRSTKTVDVFKTKLKAHFFR